MQLLLLEEVYSENVSAHTGEADNKIWPFSAFCTVENSVWDRGLDQRFDTDECETSESELFYNLDCSLVEKSFVEWSFILIPGSENDD